VPSSAAEQFLADFEGTEVAWLRPQGTPASLTTDRVLLGNGEHALEVAIATSSTQPKADDLRTLFKKRLNNRPSPVLLVVLYKAPDGTGQAAAVGTSGDPAPITGLDVARLESVCQAALGEPDRHAAARKIDRLLTSLKDNQSPGLVNSGLFASHELRTGVPQRADWEEKRQQALPLLGMQGLELIDALGYQTRRIGHACPHPWRQPAGHRDPAQRERGLRPSVPAIRDRQHQCRRHQRHAGRARADPRRA
jgi:hypothetical protein